LRKSTACPETANWLTFTTVPLSSCFTSTLCVLALTLLGIKWVGPTSSLMSSPTLKRLRTTMQQPLSATPSQAPTRWPLLSVCAEHRPRLAACQLHFRPHSLLNIKVRKKFTYFLSLAALSLLLFFSWFKTKRCFFLFFYGLNKIHPCLKFSFFLIIIFYCRWLYKVLKWSD